MASGLVRSHVLRGEWAGASIPSKCAGVLVAKFVAVDNAKLTKLQIVKFMQCIIFHCVEWKEREINIIGGLCGPIRV